MKIASNQLRTLPNNKHPLPPPTCQMLPAATFHSPREIITKRWHRTSCLDLRLCVQDWFHKSEPSHQESTNTLSFLLSPAMSYQHSVISLVPSDVIPTLCHFSCPQRCYTNTLSFLLSPAMLYQHSVISLAPSDVIPTLCHFSCPQRCETNTLSVLWSPDL
jgi:hypothetical protein